MIKNTIYSGIFAFWEVISMPRIRLSMMTYYGKMWIYIYINIHQCSIHIAFVFFWYKCLLVNEMQFHILHKHYI
jgi:hypothetical protein